MWHFIFMKSNFCFCGILFFIIPHCLYHLFYPLSLSSHFFLCHEWWSFTFQWMEDGHVPFHFYLMGIGLEILSLEGQLVIESSCTSLFESISISLCILSGARLLILENVQVKINKKKKAKKKRKEKKNIKE